MDSNKVALLIAAAVVGMFLAHSHGQSQAHAEWERGFRRLSAACRAEWDEVVYSLNDEAAAIRERGRQ